MKLIYFLLIIQAFTLMVIKADKNPNTTEIVSRVTPSRKPVIDLKINKIVASTPKLPEERKKLSIFPKNPAKYVVTSKPYAKVRTYTLRPSVMTKRTLMPVYKPSVTTNEPVTVRPLSRSLDSLIDWPAEVSESRIHRRLVEEKDVNYNAGYKITPPKVPEPENQIKDDSEEISTGLPEFEDELTNGLDNNVQVDFNTLSELDNPRIKRLAVQGPTVHDSWYFKNVARVPNEHHHDINDEDEFIFLNDNQKKSTIIASNSKSSRSLRSVNKNPTSGGFPRSKRSDNIIEEENRASTVSGYKFTGGVPRITDDLVFKNIHA